MSTQNVTPYPSRRTVRVGVAHVWISLTGAALIALSLFPFWSALGLGGKIVSLAALAISPGLILNNLVTSQREPRTPFATLGFVTAYSILWYAGITAALVAVGRTLTTQDVAWATIPLVVSGVIISFIAGPERISPSRIPTLNWKELTYGILTVVIAVATIGAGTLSITNQHSIVQPAGISTVVSLASTTQPGALLLTPAHPSIPVTVTRHGDSGVVVVWASEAGNRLTGMQSSYVLDAGETTVLPVHLPPNFSGCDTITINSNIPGAQPLSVLVTTNPNTKCAPNPSTDVFAKLGIKAGAAPTNLKDLLTMVQTTGNNADLAKLPASYRACLGETDPDAVAVCLTNAKQ